MYVCPSEVTSCNSVPFCTVKAFCSPQKAATNRIPCWSSAEVACTRIVCLGDMITNRKCAHADLFCKLSAKTLLQAAGFAITPGTMTETQRHRVRSRQAQPTLPSTSKLTGCHAARRGYLAGTCTRRLLSVIRVQQTCDRQSSSVIVCRSSITITAASKPRQRHSTSVETNTMSQVSATAAVALLQTADMQQFARRMAEYTCT